MMLGPLNPVPAVDENGKETEFFVLVVANLGYYQSLDQLRKSPFYAQLCDLYPELKDVKDVVDTGQGDLWFIRPWSKNTSLAINEYSMEVFLGEKSEDDAKVLYRTEDAKPMLLRMRADDPGSVKIHAVDNQKHVVTWIPTQTPSDNVLRQQAGIANITYNAVDNSAEFGTDYVTYFSILTCIASGMKTRSEIENELGKNNIGSSASMPIVRCASAISWPVTSPSIRKTVR